MTRLLIRFGLPALILAAGVAVAAVLVARKPSAARGAEGPAIPAVEVVAVRSAQEPVTVEASGVVKPARQVSITPEVSGKVVSVAEAVEPGGRLTAGSLLARLDARDYRLAIAQEESRVRQAELELALERGRGSVAEREWELLGAPGEAASDLALRTPQLHSADGNLEAARSGLERAQLNLARTELRAPFNSIVLDEQVEVGQLVGPGGPVVTLAGTDRFWVQISVPVEQLTHLAIPDVDGDQGSSARVFHEAGGAVLSVRDGRVLRLLGELDGQTRTAQLLIGVDDPLSTAAGQLPLLPGAFVRVQVEGRAIANALRIPRVALRGGQDVWVVDGAGALDRRAVVVGWGTDEELFVTAGLADGERVVVSPMSMPIDGMPVRIVDGTDDEALVDAR